MPRKKRDPNEIELVPDDEFEDAVQSVLDAPKERVEAEFAKMQASNKRKREARKRLSPDD